MSRYRPYPKYKDSGVEWLGEVPEHWDIKRIKQVLLTKKNAIKTGPFGSQLQNSDMLNGTIKVYNQRTVIYKDFDIGENYITAEKFSELKAFEVFAGDLLISTRGTIGKCIIAPDGIERGILHPCLMRLQLDQQIIKNHFIEIFIQSSGIALEQLKINSNSTTIDVIYSETLKEVYLPVPSNKEQIVIVNFLNNATCKIDTLIQKQQNLIELLKEKRQALISHTVTKGLNPHVKMKDSCVEWLGEVPEHWEVMKIKHMLEIPITDGPHETPEFIDEGVPFISAEAISSSCIDFNKIRGYISREANEIYSKKYSPKLHDIYMVKSGATTGVTAIVNDRVDFNIWSPLAVFRCSQKALPNFLLNYLRSKNFDKAIELHWSFGTQQNIGMNVLENLFICLPAIQEQQEISNYLDNATCKIDALISKAQQAIELLKERRTALISATVTGKIDVRGIAS